MTAVVGSSGMAGASEERSGSAQSIHLLSTRPSQEECGTGSGHSPGSFEVAAPIDRLTKEIHQCPQKASLTAAASLAPRPRRWPPPSSAARLYWENNANNFNAVDISIPAAVTVFPGEIYRAPRSWVEKSYRKLIYFHEADKGGHF